MNREEFLSNYWKFYLMLENKFIASTNFVMLNPDNFGTYSYEFVDQLLSIGSELDVVMKLTCGFDAWGDKNMGDYARVILKEFPNIKKQEVNVKGLNHPIKPFEGWNDTKDDHIKGWDAYNNVKHRRVANIKEAKLENVLNLLACLYVLEIINLGEIAKETNSIDIPDIDSALFNLKGWRYRYSSSNEIVWELKEESLVIDGGGV